jgi:hypothetical protein
MARNRVRRQESEGVSAASSFTVREIIFCRIVVETARYLEMRKIPFGESVSGQEKVQRGIIRGMALAHTKMFGNGYEPHWAAEVKACEKRATSLAKEWIDDGKPSGDGWWHRRRGRIWRSAADQAGARQ